MQANDDQRLFCCTNYRLKANVRSGPNSGPYRASMKFSEVDALLRSRFGVNNY